MSPSDLLPNWENVRDGAVTAGLLLALSFGLVWATSRYKRVPAFWQWATFSLTELAIGLTAAVAILRFGVVAAAWGVIALLVLAATFIILDVRSGVRPETPPLGQLVAPVLEPPLDKPRTVLSIVDAHEPGAAILAVGNRGDNPAKVWGRIAVRKGMSNWPAGLLTQWESADEPYLVIDPIDQQRVVVARYVRLARGGCYWVLPFFTPTREKGEIATPQGPERLTGSSLPEENPRAVEIIVTFMAEPAIAPPLPTILIQLYGESIKVSL